MNVWWSELTKLEQIYWIIAATASLFFLFQMVLTFFGGGDLEDSHLDVDSEVDGDHGMGFQFFTLKNLIAFFTIFGWVGIACLGNGLGDGLSVLVSVVAGLLMMTIMAAIFYYTSKLAEDGSLDLKNALGAQGEVYLTIPKSKGGFGKIHIKIQGSLRELEAMTNDEEDAATGSLVKVVEVSNNNILTVTKQF
ncbi:MAG: hypothetical protein H6607_12135 [Flavobacteriales bacterium]|nr:hypothetical protein [Flavobacteriales bacterium]